MTPPHGGGALAAPRNVGSSPSCLASRQPAGGVGCEVALENRRGVRGSDLRVRQRRVHSQHVTITSSHPLPKEETRTELALEGVWRVVVLNDPVNLMSYVVMVFKKVFGFDEQTARQKMLEVHEQGRSIVWSGLREKAEAYVFTLQQWHLTAVLEPDEAH